MQILQDLYKISSPSHNEFKMVNFITKHLDERSISYDIDMYGNIYRISPGTPLLCAHTDQIFYSAVKTVKVKGNKIYGLDVKKQQTSLGADDKNGIYVILKMLEIHKDISFIFSTAEENGGNIRHLLDYDFSVSTCLYGIVLDRKNNSDIIGSDNNYCTLKFEKDISKIGKKYGYKASPGGYSDTDQLSKHISCVNLSVAYHMPHSRQEWTDKAGLINTLHFVNDILHNVKSRYSKNMIKPKRIFDWKRLTKTYSTSDFHNYEAVDRTWPDEDIEDEPYSFCVKCREELSSSDYLDGVCPWCNATIPFDQTIIKDKYYYD